MGKKASKAPDPVATAQAQAEANRINTFTPYGNIRYGEVDETGAWSPGKGAALQMEESPFQSQFRGQQEAIASGLAGNFLDQFNQNGLPNVGEAGLTINQLKGYSPDLASLPTSRSTASMESALTPRMDINSLGTDFSGDSMRVEDATYKRGLNLLNPTFDEDRRRQEQTLANRGISIDSDAYRGQQDRLDRSQGMQKENLALSSVLAGRQEQGRLFGQNLAKFQAGEGQRASSFGEQTTFRGIEDAARAQQFGEQQQVFNNMMGLRNAKEQSRSSRINELAALLGGQQINPQIQQPNTAQVDIAGPTMAAYQAKVNSANANNQAMGGLAGNAAMAAAMFFSDRRLKDNSILRGEKNGHKVYEFSYTGKPERYLGVMADEVNEIMPEAVSRDSEGYMMVDYSKLGFDMEVLDGSR